MSKFFDTKGVVDELQRQISPRTLEKWRCIGQGPPFYRLGRKVVYRAEDLQAWVESRRRNNTSD